MNAMHTSVFFLFLASHPGMLHAPSIEEEEGALDENHGELIKQTERMST
jgi:hypothetical protein